MHRFAPPADVAALHAGRRSPRGGPWGEGRWGRGHLPFYGKMRIADCLVCLWRGGGKFTVRSPFRFWAFRHCAVCIHSVVSRCFREWNGNGKKERSVWYSPRITVDFLSLGRPVGTLSKNKTLQRSVLILSFQRLRAGKSAWSLCDT